jgi:hypothetical protein
MYTNNTGRNGVASSLRQIEVAGQHCESSHARTTLLLKQWKQRPNCRGQKRRGQDRAHREGREKQGRDDAKRALAAHLQYMWLWCRNAGTPASCSMTTRGTTKECVKKRLFVMENTVVSTVTPQ